jgi:hypothetical protein
MRLEITREDGLRNDLLLRIERSEIDSALLTIGHRDRLMALPGIPRHRAPTGVERQGLEDAKLPIEQHLSQLGLVDASRRATARAVAVSNRNLGTNHGHLAYQRTADPRVFALCEDPCDYPAYSCLTAWRGGGLSIESLLFDAPAQRVRDAAEGRDLTEEIEWATFGPQVLRRGAVAGMDALVDRFYDVRHLFAFDPRTTEGDAIRSRIYAGYPERFRENVRAVWRSGVPRARYVHNAIGLSDDAIVIAQREGTVEEIGLALKDAGASDGIILDNGGSVACWAWWVNDYAGGLLSPTVDYRPPGTSAIAFVLKGAVKPTLPGGSVSFSAL